MIINLENTNVSNDNIFPVQGTSYFVDCSC